MTEHTQLANAVLVIVFAAAISLAGQLLIRNQSVLAPNPAPYVIPLPP
jgi:hypothetical protein